MYWYTIYTVAIIVAIRALENRLWQDVTIGWCLIGGVAAQVIIHIWPEK